ncbi:hypothetical protein A410_0077 [Listeria monocytogenes serotype 1/2b str. 10-0811]|nr:hypothetical protein A410_0077 [Listeria monocytogenes serotype 1/2b str. 10-0811]
MSLGENPVLVDIKNHQYESA